MNRAVGLHMTGDTIFFFGLHLDCFLGLVSLLGMLSESISRCHLLTLLDLVFFNNPVWMLLMWFWHVYSPPAEILNRKRNLHYQ
ncbi:unnamed protein product [Arctogadus glacialis]